MAAISEASVSWTTARSFPRTSSEEPPRCRCLIIAFIMLTELWPSPDHNNMIQIIFFLRRVSHCQGPERMPPPNIEASSPQREILAAGQRAGHMGFRERQESARRRGCELQGP